MRFDHELARDTLVDWRINKWQSDRLWSLGSAKSISQSSYPESPESPAYSGQNLDANAIIGDCVAHHWDFAHSVEYEPANGVEPIVLDGRIEIFI